MIVPVRLEMTGGTGSDRKGAFGSIQGNVLRQSIICNDLHDAKPLASRFGTSGRGESEQEAWKKKGNAGSEGGWSERNF